MPKGLISSIIVSIILTSCATVPNTIYKDAGIYFKITEDFKIGRANTHKKNQATYIPLYGRDKNIYAKFSVVWLPGNWNLDKEIQNYVDGLNSIYKDDPINKPQYSEIKETKFGSNNARQIDYVVPNDGPRIGSYITFHCNNFTVIVGHHSTVEGQAMTDKCRKLIEETYYCIQTNNKQDNKN